MKAVSFIAAVVTAAVAFGAVSYFKNLPPSQSAEAEAFAESLPKVIEDGPQPKLVVADPGIIYEFGEMTLGDVLDHTFIIRNEGEGPLELKKIATTCKCTLGEIGEDIIAPGEETEIVLTWEPKSPAREFLQSAQIRTNDPAYLDLVLNVKGSVVSDVSVVPSDVWSIGTISEDLDSQTEITGLIVSESDKDFKVLEVETGNPAITVELKPIDDPDLLAMAKEGGTARAGTELTLLIRPEIPVGRFTYPIKVKTNSKLNPELTINLGGNRSGPFTILGKGWVGANSQLNLRSFKASKGVEHSMTMFVEKGDEPLELTPVSITPGVLSVSSEQDKDYSNERLERYRINFSIPAGITPGAYDSPEDRVRVELKSNHPRFSELKLEVRFIAEP